jgi:hypothetical protein
MLSCVYAESLDNYTYRNCDPSSRALFKARSYLEEIFESSIQNLSKENKHCNDSIFMKGPEKKKTVQNDENCLMDFTNEFKKKTANGKNKFAKKMAP